MPHLPDASEDEDDGLSDGPPQDPLVGALAGQTEALFTILWDGGPRIKCAGKTGAGWASHPPPIGYSTMGPNASYLPDSSASAPRK